MKKIFCVLFTGIVITNLFSQGSVLLVGGGQENYNDWSDLPYGWFVQKADSGKIINIDVSSASSAERPDDAVEEPSVDVECSSRSAPAVGRDLLAGLLVADRRVRSRRCTQW